MNRPGGYFETDEIASLVKRGLFYARAGVPLNFQGAAGIGKTAIALEIARRLGRKVSVMTGNDWLGSDDLIGKEVGQSTHSVVDKYVQRVRRSEASLRYDWEASLLAEAMREGHTLVYDEFTRSSAKANGILLSVLEEGVLITTDRLAGTPNIEAHPDFRIILTSNPHDYAGVNSAPDALLECEAQAAQRSPVGLNAQNIIYSGGRFELQLQVRDCEGEAFTVGTGLHFAMVYTQQSHVIGASVF